MAQLDKQRTELMASSTVTLQRYVRGFLARQHYKRTRRAIITLQVNIFPAWMPHRGGVVLRLKDGHHICMCLQPSGSIATPSKLI